MALLALLMSPQLALADAVQQFKFADDSYFINVILKGILGNVINPGADGAGSVITGPGTLGEIFRTFNLGVAFFGSVIVVFVTVVGVLQSGNDGEFLGRKWSSMWVPIRFATGSALMLPLSASGYSYCQAIVLWIASQGIGFADTLWSTVVSNLVVKNGIQLTKGVDTLGIVRTVAMAEVCSAFVNAMNQSIASESGTTAPDSISLRTMDTPGTIYNGYLRSVKWDWTRSDSSSTVGNKESTCGSLSYSVNMSANALSDPYEGVRNSMANYHLKTIQKMAQDDFRPLAMTIANKYAARSGQGVESSYNPASDLQTMAALIASNADVYNQGLSIEVTRALAASSYKTETTPDTKDMTKYGFAMAGMWYIELLKVHNTARYALNTPELGIVNLDSLKYEPSLVKIADAWRQASSVLMSTKDGAAGYTSAVQTGTSSGSSFASNSSPATIRTTTTNFKISTSDIIDKGLVNGFFVMVASWLRETVFGVGQFSNGTSNNVWSNNGVNSNFQKTSRDPNVSTILQLKDKGDSILDAAAILMLIDVGAKVSSGVIEGATHGVTGKVLEAGADIATGGTSKFALIATYVLEKLSGYIVGAASAMFLLGLMLSVFIPMMPYVMWVGAIVGLVILILEGLVAIMLWAVMMMHPSGEGITSDYNRQGMNMLLAVFMRPALLLMGLVLGIFMVEPLVMFVNDTFKIVMTSVQANTFTGLFSIVAFIAIYVSLVLMIVDKSFAMIHLIPDRVLTWIGGQGALTGDEREAGHKGHQMISTAGGALSSVMMGKSMGSAMNKGPKRPTVKPK